MISRAEFLERVRREMAKASGLVPAEASPRPPDPVEAAAAVRDRVRRETEALFARFRAEAEKVGVGVHRVATPAEAGEVVLGLAVAHGVRRVATWDGRRLGPAGAVAARLREAGLEVVEGSPEEIGETARGALRGTLAAADLGLTAGDLAVAETGSLVLASGAGKGRAVSLLPAIHVAVFGREALVPGLEEAGVVLEAWQAAPPAGAGANVVFITGPSRTADIELTLTRGVHGPKEVHAVFVDAPGGG